VSSFSDLFVAFREAVHRWWVFLAAHTSELTGWLANRVVPRSGSDGLEGMGPFNGADPREQEALADPIRQSTWRARSALAYGSAQNGYSRAGKAAAPWLRDLRRLGPRWGIAAVLAGALTAGLALGLTLPTAQAADPVRSAGATPSAAISALAAQSDGAIAVDSGTSGSTKQASSAAKAPTTTAASPKRSEASDEGRATAVDDSAVPSSSVTTTSSSQKSSSDLSKSWGDLTARYPTTYGNTISPSAALLASIPQHLPLPGSSGSGRRVIYDGISQHLWIVAADGSLVRDYPVTGRSDRPGAGTYHVYSMSTSSYNPIAKVSFGHMVRFAHGVTGAAIGFHSIPVWYNGKPLQTAASLGLALGRGGCVRQTVANATFLYGWVHLGDKVVVVR
jgi:hypothetical protein